MTRQQVLDLYFLDARHKLVELAAFLDRVEQRIVRRKKQKAKRVLVTCSDPATKPIAKAEGKGACGAWDSKNEAPSSKLHPPEKLRISITKIAAPFEVWNFSGGWSLDVGAFAAHHASRITHHDEIHRTPRPHGQP